MLPKSSSKATSSSTPRLRSTLGLPKPLKKDRINLKRKKLRLKKWEIVREKVIESARVGDMYQCYHCGNLFPRNEVCADHYPYSRGSRPDLFLDPKNLVCSCQFCNQSNSPNRNAHS